MTAALIKYEAACRALAECKSEKQAFVALGRAMFRPSVRTSCAVCGKFKSLTQAHHLVPLSLQFDRGNGAPSNEHVWLCPSHHVAVHILIGQANAKQVRASKACVAVVCELAEDMPAFKRLINIAEGAWA